MYYMLYFGTILFCFFYIDIAAGTQPVFIHEIVIYTAAVQEPNRLYTLLPDV